MTRAVDAPGPAMRRRRVRANGAGTSLSLGIAVVYLSLIVLIPLAALAWKAVGGGWSQFWTAVTSPEAVAALRLTFEVTGAAVAINAVMGTLIAWVLVRDAFPGRAVVDVLLDLPFALPTIVAGLTLLSLYGVNGPLGVNIAYTKAGIVLALMFVTLPLAFAHLPFGVLAAIVFFVLLGIAALASAISLLEMTVAFLQRRGWSRMFATVISASSCWVVGLASVLSFNLWKDWFPLGSIPAFERATIFDLLDQLTSNILLPAGGLALAIFGGWVLSAQILTEELYLSPQGVTVLRSVLRYVVSFAIAAVLASLRFWAVSV